VREQQRERERERDGGRVGGRVPEDIGVMREREREIKARGEAREDERRWGETGGVDGG